MQEISEVTVLDDALNIMFKNGKNLIFEDCWLRDHCRCRSCYHHDTFQRAKHILELPEAKIKDVTHERTQIRITWDDGHLTDFDAAFLSDFDFQTWKENRRLRPILWSGQSVSKKVSKVPVERFLNCADGAKDVFQSLLDYGVALIEGVEASEAATEVVCRALGGVQHTIFGGMWTFTNSAARADTAYTNLPLASHHDNTYFTEAAGLQILHCLEHSNRTGGETTLVDGFYGAQMLQRDHPEDYEFLTTFKVDAEYIEKGHHFKYGAPVIITDNETKGVIQIRYNVYDRAPMAFKNKQECRAYYRSLKNLGRYYEDPANQWQFKLTPGLLMVMDNFRLLHGRTAFTGTRVLSGSYVARSDWLDRARTLGLIK